MNLLDGQVNYLHENGRIDWVGLGCYSGWGGAVGGVIKWQPPTAWRRKLRAFKFCINFNLEAKGPKEDETVDRRLQRGRGGG